MTAWNTNTRPEQQESQEQREERVRLEAHNELRLLAEREGCYNTHSNDYARQLADGEVSVLSEYLLEFGCDLTGLVRAGKIEPVIGRNEETRRMVQILCRKTKNNPIIIGEPGVGKTALAEGLAYRIVRDDVPSSLKGAHIYSLDVGSLVAGTSMQGELEKRVKQIIDELVESEENILLFIDEIHNIVGTGAEVDIGNLLKPALARGALHCIGATTLDEHREHIEKDSALERRFQPILCDEPNIDDSISIMRGIKERFEIFHGVSIRDRALVAAVKLSDRYITSRFLPDKAVDCIDEACAKIRTELESMPTELDALTREIKQLEIEQAALALETDSFSARRLVVIEEELTVKREEHEGMFKQWEIEKSALTEITRVRTALEDAKDELEVAERQDETERAAELTYNVIPAMEAELANHESILAEINGGAMLHQAIDEDEIAEVIAKWSGIPVDNLKGDSKEKILNMPETLHKRVIGQEEAVDLVSKAMIRSGSGIKDPGCPIGSFIFLGPTGVGKTELAKALAESMFDDENCIIRVDMSEYMEKHSVSRLIGSPPGYVGYGEGGQLTEAVRRKPYSVVLFDEIEKAHPDVFNTMLQILDDGRCTDGSGRVVDFKNTVIIMTSNIGSPYLLEGIQADGTISEGARTQAMDLLKSKFRPEFLNRIDDIIMFTPLGLPEIMQIIELMVASIRKRLDDKGIGLVITDEAKEFVANAAYDPAYGARPIKRFLVHELETILGVALIRDEVKEDDVVNIVVDGGKLAIRV